ncbi:hypothetical protein SAMN05421678_102396 [Actinopolymorpha cephalotaxi]|uniref:Type IV secretory pathway ATPase VirB11/archaellum biosynthesis ATPase n=1 Tax=Actinopolymorpha cephalotaxi TaxID=504797 RepID=A0A1I2M6U6_9ACTN|nr:hypothetical protein [Actinopolymorpha cephalotaxi]NYH81534.1 type IV secretory pathway ATPase VirB11/archaellum biosynthesis ATPase [Actinopolymorpha cephalotaxi]SFF85146.1 hypothetical protein SAMN05421678_102396 [Actinopolymorpha cephalotaxi]
MITLTDMVANGSVTEDGADLLRRIAASGESFLVYALPRNAGKSTLTNAILAEVPADVPRQEFFGTREEVAELTADPDRGYLVVAEMGHRGRPGYLAGDEVERAFELVASGYRLASSLHADSVAEVFDVLAHNGIAADAAAGIRYLVKVRGLGDLGDPSTRRVVEHINEVTGLGADGPAYSVLYEWASQATSRTAP